MYAMVALPMYAKIVLLVCLHQISAEIGYVGHTPGLQPDSTDDDGHHDYHDHEWNGTDYFDGPVHYNEHEEIREMRDITLWDFQKCFHDRNMLKPVADSVSQNGTYFYFERTRIKEPAMRIIGITPDCFVYYGWLHELANVTTDFGDSPFMPDADKRQYFGATECSAFKPYIIRTEGKKLQLFIAVRRAARRLLVQSIAGKGYLHGSSEAGVMWTQMNPRARQEQFLTNEFPQDFTFDTMNNLMYRIFILGRSSKGSRILEMKVFIDEHDNMFPFITSQVLLVDPLVHAPIHGVELIATHSAQYLSTITSGFIFVRQVFDGDELLKGRYVTYAISIESLATDSMEGGLPNFDYDGHLYRARWFTAYLNRHCEFIGNYMIFTQPMPQKIEQWNPTDIPRPELTLWKAANHRFFNHLRFHRRMSYPHVAHRSMRRGIFRGWIRCLPMILLNVVLLLLIFFGIEFIIHIHEKRKARRTGLSRSYSAASF